LLGVCCAAVRLAPPHLRCTYLLDLAINDQFDNGNPQIEVDNGEAVAYSVSKLIIDGANGEGEPFYVVGRVVSSVASPVMANGLGIGRSG
jgi:hypothetical protein